MRVAANGVEDASRFELAVAVLALEIVDRVGEGEPAVPGERPRTGDRLGCMAVDLEIPPEGEVAERREEDRVVGGGDEVERPSHDGRLHHVAAHYGPLERAAPEVDRSRPETDVRRRRPLRLQARDPLDRARDGQ